MSPGLQANNRGLNSLDNSTASRRSVEAPWKPAYSAATSDPCQTVQKMVVPISTIWKHDHWDGRYAGVFRLFCNFSNPPSCHGPLKLSLIAHGPGPKGKGSAGVVAQLLGKDFPQTYSLLVLLLCWYSVGAPRVLYSVLVSFPALST